MTAKNLIGLAIFTATTIWAADTITPLDVKPGLWETTVTIQASGAPPIPAEILEKMTPEQRARIEATVKGQSQKPTVKKTCLKQEDLQKPLTFGNASEACKQTLVASSRMKQEITVECAKGGVKTTGTIRFGAIDTEHVKFSSQMSAGEGAHAMTITAAGTSRWIGAACEEPK